MAKIAFTKLGLKPNKEIKTIVWNEQTIEVMQYLPVNDKLELMHTETYYSAPELLSGDKYNNKIDL
jgi:hypothetical protein